MEDENLVDRAFGPKLSCDEQGRNPPTDRVTAFMVPIVTTILLVLVISWSTLKTIEYHEVIQSNPTYRNVILVVNGVAVVSAIIVVIYSILSHAER